MIHPTFDPFRFPARARTLTILFLLVLAAVVVGASGSERASAAVTCDKFTAPTGSDTASGTSSAPFRTAQKLASSLSAGQTGCLMGGTYSGNLTISSGGSSDTSRLTLTTAPGYPQATLSVGNVYVKPTAPYVTLSNLRISGTSPVVTVQLFGDGAVLQGNDITNAHRGASCVIVGEYEGSYARIVRDVVIDGNRIHDCGLASNGAHDHGIYLASSRYAKVTNNVIYDNVGGWGIQLWADAHYSDVSHNIIDGNYGGNVIIAGGSYSADGPSSNNSFVDNVITWPKTRYNVEAYWQGSSTGANNVFTSNCVYGGGAGNWGSAGQGYSSSGTTVANPLYVDRAGKDFRLQAESPCAGKGPAASGGSSDPAPPAPTPDGDFTFATSSSSVVVRRSSSTDTSLTVTATNGFSEPVYLSATGLPAGVTVSFGQNPVTTISSTSTRVTFTASGSATRGLFTVTLIGTGGAKSHSLQLALRVRS